MTLKKGGCFWSSLGDDALLLRDAWESKGCVVVELTWYLWTERQKKKRNPSISQMGSMVIFFIIELWFCNHAIQCWWQTLATKRRTNLWNKKKVDENELGDTPSWRLFVSVRESAPPEVMGVKVFSIWIILNHGETLCQWRISYTWGNGCKGFQHLDHHHDHYYCCNCNPNSRTVTNPNTL